MYVFIDEFTIVAAPPAELWSLLRDFDGLPAWHPLVLHSEIEHGRAGSDVGCVRRYRRRDGIELREQLVALDDERYSTTYRLLEPPFAVTDYLARLEVSPLTAAGRTRVHWHAEFGCGQADADALLAGVTTVFRDGLTALAQRWERSV